jgi:hypothetical protein
MLSNTFVSLRRLLGGSRLAADGQSFQETRPAPAARSRSADLIFRLKAWPQLDDAERTAEIYRILSVMSSQPVNRQWLAARCTMAPQALDKLLGQLVAQGALEVIDPARFAGREAVQA